MPDLVGVGGQVDVALGVAVEQPGLLVVQVVEGRGFGAVAEERLVGPHHLGVLPEPVADPLAQADDAVDPVRGEERVAEDLLRLLKPRGRAAGPGRPTSARSAQGERSKIHKFLKDVMETAFGPANRRKWLRSKKLWNHVRSPYRSAAQTM
jgi:hypothetical protein